MNGGIHCKSGTSFMGLAVNAGLSISNEERQNIPHSNMNMKTAFFAREMPVLGGRLYEVAVLSIPYSPI